jgi:hypothetical protein
MKTNQSKSLIIYLLVGFMYCFITKNIISISFGSYGGDPFYIISNPSIDKEFWYISLLSFVLTIKLCFNSSHAQVVTILKSYKRINSLFEIYAQYRQRKTFMIFIKSIFYISSALVFMLGVGIADLSDWNLGKFLGWLLFLYTTILFNLNFKIVGVKKTQ